MICLFLRVKNRMWKGNGADRIRRNILKYIFNMYIIYTIIQVFHSTRHRLSIGRVNRNQMLIERVDIEVQCRHCCSCCCCWYGLWLIEFEVQFGKGKAAGRMAKHATGFTHEWTLPWWCVYLHTQVAVLGVLVGIFTWKGRSFFI